MEDENEPVIMDIGSGYLKAGFAHDDAPKLTIPMIVGKPKYDGIMVGMESKPAYFGYDALSPLKKPKLNIYNPVENGLVVDIKLLEEIFEDIFCNGPM